MTAKTQTAKSVITTPVGRVSYPSVFKPTKMEGSVGNPKYEITLLFDKTEDLTAMKKIAREATVARWGADKEKWPANLKTPFRDGDRERPDNPEYKGKIFVRMSTEQKPGLVDANVEPIIDAGDFYPGCFARCRINAFTYDKSGNRGVSFGLNHIQKVKDGQPLGGSREAVEEAFEPIEADDPDNYGDGAPKDDDLDDLGF